MINIESLCKFLSKAKKSTYASGDESEKIIEKDKSTTLVFNQGDWKYHDNYFGGEPYGGREVVFFKDEPVYIMTYYGLVDGKVTNFSEVYKVLQNALLLIPDDKPYRGPKKYCEGAYIYINNFEGNIDDFFGEEVIKHNGEEIYKAKYMGGFVDQRK